jgi:hypothetical protein
MNQNFLSIMYNDSTIFASISLDRTAKLTDDAQQWFLDCGYDCVGYYQIKYINYFSHDADDWQLYYCNVYMPSDLISMFLLRWNPQLLTERLIV